MYKVVKDKPNRILNIARISKEIIVDLAYANTNNFTGEIVPGYLKNNAYLDSKALDALLLANKYFLNRNLTLYIFDAYRPVSSVEYFYNDWRIKSENIKNKNKFYPNLSKEELFSKGLIAKKSSHSRCSTIDLTLFDLKTNLKVDMGTHFDFYDSKSETFSTLISEMHQKNRIILKEGMEKFGFINYIKEWWHFRLDDEFFKDTYFDFKVS